MTEENVDYFFEESLRHEKLKLSGASSGESSIPKEGILNMIRSLTPQQAARNARLQIHLPEPETLIPD